MMQSKTRQSLKRVAPSQSPTVFIVDDDPTSREAVLALVESMGMSGICFATAEEYLQVTQAARPACLVLDLVLEGISGEELLRQQAEVSLSIPVVMISAFADVPTVVRCMEYGAVALLEKPCGDGVLAKAIYGAIDFDREQQQLITRLRQLSLVDQVLAQREREVLHLVVEGQLNKKIARDLDVSQRTVENVRSKLMRKFGVENATGLAVKYTELRMLRDYAHRIRPQCSPKRAL